MSTEQWHPLKTYSEGERCRYGGKLFEARFDLTRGLKPVGPLSQKFWRSLPTVKTDSSRTSFTGRKLTNG